MTNYTEQKLWHLEHFNFMKRLKKQDAMYLAEAMVMKHYKKKDNIILPYSEQRNVYFIKQGIVKIGRVNNDGQETLHYLIKSGDLFGFMGLLDIEEKESHVVAISDCIVCVIDEPNMKYIINRNEALNNYVHKISGFRIKKLESRISDMIYKNAQTRIEEFIYSFVQEFGKAENGDFIVKNFLSNQDIAKLTSTSRQVVNAVMNRMRQDNKIDYDTKYIRIKQGYSIAMEAQFIGF